jgi:LysR family glycine cleavage system transcriptional activator
MPIRKLPPLSGLAAFEAVARHRSFTKAATELCLTHSAVSQRVGMLERHLKGQLFVRSNRSVELTAAGARYLETVRDALSRIAAASEQFSESTAKLVRLSVVPAFASNWLIQRLAGFRERHPDIDLEIQSTPQLANVSSGEVDVAVRWGKGDWPGVEKRLLFRDTLFPVCSRAYRRKLGRMRQPADLRRAVLLRQSIQPWKPWFSAAGLDWPEPARGPSFTDSALMLQAAADGHGIALARQILAAPLLQAGRLVRVFDIGVTTDRAFYVIYPAYPPRRAEVAAFVDWIAQVASAPDAQ